MILYQITSNYFCAGFITKESKVIKAAPIIHYIINKTIKDVIDYVTKKNWTISRISIFKERIIKL